SYNEGLVFESEYKFKAGINLAERVRNSGATAAFVTDDELAIGLLDGMLDAGVKVPEEFEIITSNNSLLTEVSRPRLSSITQPLYDIGAVSMRLLTKLMNKEEIEEKTLDLPYGNRTIIENLSMQAEFGEIIGLVAPNGTGKTTFFNAISGLIPKKNGNISLNKIDYNSRGATYLKELFFLKVVKIYMII
ncbi:substrate-binding domain-containing protein, partial [Enterococcus faecalis]